MAKVYDQIRPATHADLPGILAIYNDAVLHTTASFDEQPSTLDARTAWFNERQARGFPVFVAEDVGQIVGWSSLGSFRDRFGYRFTVENSVYVAAERRGQGIGRLLMEPLIAATIAGGWHTIIAVVDATNTASIRLHTSFGFVQAAHFREVGFKFGRWLDLVFLQWHAPGERHP